ncbi:hypothetical protein [Marinomonas ostreistagni]|uniref:hypothetical protein n=1 Tax=Marinomonas ostreistagni TaxID=359209 RepID=UPI001950E58A|nr:hypothetical protein [Marinomonas ostreistagni]MBM6549821.1 hypothetical protein [Marinomonas ostreistagni]
MKGFNRNFIKHITAASLVSVACFVSADSHADLWIIANAEAKVDDLSRSEVRQIFMGGTLSRKFTAIALPAGSDVRNQFNVDIIGLTESRIQAYWSQLLFTGRSTPPMEMASVNDAVRHVSEHDNTIAYVPEQTQLPDNVVVVYER